MKQISDDALIYASAKEEEILANPELNMSAEMGKPYSVKPDVWVKEGDIITVGSMSCRVLETPGHTKGSICFYFENDGILISGDTMFCESYGRTDFYSGNAKEMKESLNRLMEELPEETKVYPGHGDFTTIGHERKDRI